MSRELILIPKEEFDELMQSHSIKADKNTTINEENDEDKKVKEDKNAIDDQYQKEKNDHNHQRETRNEKDSSKIAQFATKDKFEDAGDVKDKSTEQIGRGSQEYVKRKPSAIFRYSGEKKGKTLKRKWISIEI